MSNYTYFSSFNPSFSFLIEKCLRTELRNVNIVDQKHEIIVFETSVDPDVVSRLPFLKDTYLNIRDINKFKNLYPKLGKPSIRVLPKGPGVKPGDYREEVKSIVNSIRDFASIDRAHPDYEICYCKYKDFEGTGLRITSKNEWFQMIEEGSLDIDILYFLNFLSHPNKDDIVLDPFCGAGGIPIIRSEIGQYRKIFAIDKNVSPIRTKLRNLNTHLENFEISAGDSRSLKELKNKCIDKIITDPPWGDSKEYKDIQGLYRDSFIQFERVLKPKGLIVLLASNDELISNSIEESKTPFFIEKKYDVVVAGKEAVIHIIRKKHA